mmetsp:Transcript_2363/g.4285  ORF Transcript_2363/g.4285 Transcript_2363/m.4285 type:complete len:89 (+) Transcript_2363:1039-1305(+)
MSAAMALPSISWEVMLVEANDRTSVSFVAKPRAVERNSAGKMAKKANRRHEDVSGEEIMAARKQEMIKSQFQTLVLLFQTTGKTSTKF